jgi:hypothetical protein
VASVQEEDDADDPEEISDDELGEKTVRIIRLGQEIHRLRTSVANTYIHK